MIVLTCVTYHLTIIVYILFSDQVVELVCGGKSHCDTLFQNYSVSRFEPRPRLFCAVSAAALTVTHSLDALLDYETIWN